MGVSLKPATSASGSAMRALTVTGGSWAAGTAAGAGGAGGVVCEAAAPQSPAHASAMLLRLKRRSGEEELYEFAIVFPFDGRWALLRTGR
jgi:hypothetical protein